MKLVDDEPLVDLLGVQIQRQTAQARRAEPPVPLAFLLFFLLRRQGDSPQDPPSVTSTPDIDIEPLHLQADHFQTLVGQGQPIEVDFETLADQALLFGAAHGQAGDGEMAGEGVEIDIFNATFNGSVLVQPGGHSPADAVGQE